MENFKFDIQNFANVIHGNSSKNQLTNTGDNTQIYGLAGNDTIESVNKKNAFLIGGSGNDILRMTGGSGTLSGGAGADTFYLNYSASASLSAVIEDIDPSKDEIVITYGGNSAPNLNYSISGNNVIWTDEEGYFNVTLKGSSSSGDYYDEDCNEYIWDVLWLVNQERERQGLNQLILATGLMDATSIRAVEIEELYSHTRPNGTSCFTAVKKSYGGMGENIYTSPTTPEAAMEGWMNSTGHRENILRDYFKFIGIGYYHNENSATWKDQWVQMFGGSAYNTSSFSAEEILKTNITTKTGSVPAETPNDEFKISNGNTHIVIGGNYKIDNDFSGTIKITANDAVTIDGTAATNLNDIKILAYSETVNLSINSGDNDNNLIVERASLHNGDISSWQPPNSNKVTIDGGKGNDSVSNKNINAVILGGEGNDYIYNEGDSVKIDGGADADYIIGKSNSVSINGSAGNDTLRTEKTATYNWDLSAWEYTAYNKATIYGGAGDDYISNENINAVIFAGDDNDNVKNYSDFVTVDGSSGNDIIINGEFFAKGGVKVSLSGGSGDDTITNSGSNSVIEGGAGNDLIHNGYYFYENWNSYYDSSYNGEHDDSLKSSNVTIEGGAGNDTIYNRGENVIYKYKKGDGNDTVYGVNSDYTLQITGGSYSTVVSGNDIIVKIGSGSITLKDTKNIEELNIDGTFDSTSGGDDTLKTITNTKSDTLINGTSGNDTIISAKYDGEVLYRNTIKGGAGNDNIHVYLSSLNAVYGDAGNDSIYADYNDDITISGGDGNDTLVIEGANSPVVNGGKGNDLVTLRASNSLYQYASGDGYDTIYGLDSNDTVKITGAKYTTVKSGSDLKVNVGSGSILLKNAANTAVKIVGTLEGGGSSTTVPASTLPAGISIKNSVLTASTAFKGNKIDLANYSGAKKVNASALSQVVTIVGSSADNSIKGGKGADYINGVAGKNTISGGTGNDSILGGSGNDKILGEIGNDTLSGGNGNDTLTGGAGADIFIYSSGNDLITDYKAGEDKISASYTSSTVKGSDVILTTANGNLTVKGAKDKIVTFADGSEKIFFADTSYAPLATGLTYDAKRTVLTASNKFTGTEINLTNYLSTATKFNGANAKNALKITGNTENNSLKGSKGADTISGGSGNDTLSGGAGKDTFIYSSGNDLITDYKAGEDKISASYTSSSVKGSDVILTTASGNLTVKGAKDKIVTFADGSEKIFFADTSYSPLATGLTYDSKRTVLTASNKFTGTEINLSNYLSTSTKFNGANAKNALKITGNAENNSMKGSKGADTISGGSGNDTLTGGAGKDTFIYSSGNDLITDYKAGDDTISASYTSSSVKGSDVILTTASGNLTVKGAKDKIVTFADGSEKIFFADTSYSPLATGLTYDSKRTVLTASNKFTGTEINLSNYLSTSTKFNGANAKNALEITGKATDDSLKGGKGADTLSGGSGNDTLTGGAGKDIFIYSSGNDLITDYKAGDDKIKIGTITSSTVKGSDVILTTASGTLTIKNAKKKEITFLDSSNNITNQTYSKTFDLFEDNNFISDAPQISEITEQKFSVTQIQTQTPNYSALVQNNSEILTFTKEK